MTAQRLRIVKKVKAEDFNLCVPGDFETEELGATEPEVVLSDPTVSLYCVDPESPRAFFIRAKQVLDPTGVSFFHLHQYKQAQELVVLPFETMHRLAAAVPFDESKLILLHNTGRCGSTLLSKALGELSDVRSFSEPDTLTKVTNLRPADGSRDSAIADLCESVVRLQCKPVIGLEGRYTALKFRSQVMELADLLYQRFPKAKAMFMYRDALTWLDSFLRTLLRDVEFTDEVNREWEMALAPCHPILREYHDPEKPMSPARLWILGWVSSMERYLLLCEQGMQAPAVRFEDFRSQPLVVCRRLLQSLEVGAEQWLQEGSEELARVEAVFRADSQKDTFLAQSKAAPAGSTPEHYLEEARQILRGRPQVRESGFVVPGTLEFARATP